MKTENEDQLDALLKSKLQRNTFVMKDEYWERARKMVDESRPEKTRRPFLFLLAGFILAGVFSGAAVYYLQKADQPLTLDGAHPATTAIASVDEGQQAVLPSTGATRSPDVYPERKKSVPVENVGNAKEEAVRTNSRNMPVTGSPQHIAKSPALFDSPAQPAAVYDAKTPPEERVRVMEKELVQDMNRQTIPVGKDMADVEVTRKQTSYQRISKADLLPSGFSGNNQAVKPPARYPLKPRYGFKQVEVGINHYNASLFSGNAVNYHVAARYGIHLGARADLSIGIGYSRLHMSNAIREYRTVTYGLGEQVETTGINTIRLDYLEMPVNVHYLLHGRHGLTAGASFNYLVSSADLVKKPGQVTYEEKAANYYTAFSPVDVQLSMGYTFMCTSRIMLAATGHYGLVDVTRNNVFRNNSAYHHSGLRLTIGYQLN